MTKQYLLIECHEGMNHYDTFRDVIRHMHEASIKYGDRYLENIELFSRLRIEHLDKILLRYELAGEVEEL